MTVSSKKRISYTIPLHQEQSQSSTSGAHLLGVNALQWDTTNDILFSAGRDAVICAWRGDRKSNILMMKGHSDWVNDIVLCNRNQSIVSASSDRTVKLWNLSPFHENLTQPSAVNLGHHNDFVKCLASADEAGWVASGGLDSKINLWDVTQTGGIRCTLDSSAPNETSHLLTTFFNVSVSNAKVSNPSVTPLSSVYCIATNPSGSIVLSGSPDKIIRLYDPRTRNKIGQLSGHTDHIRALLVSDDGRLALSASSDTTIKLWSLHTNRPISTFNHHNTSVWSLHSKDSNIEIFYSGDKSGYINKVDRKRNRGISQLRSNTNLGSNDRASLYGTGIHGMGGIVKICKEKQGVLGIVAKEENIDGSQMGNLWACTMNSSLNCYSDPPLRHLRQSVTSHSSIAVSQKLAVPSSLSPVSFVVDSDSESDLDSYLADEDDENNMSIPLVNETPIAIIRGLSGIKKCALMSNKRCVLSLDTEGNVALWDILQCRQLKTFGHANFAEILQQEDIPVFTCTWCSIDSKIGAITVHLDESRVFDAEIYFDEIAFMDGVQYVQDQRVNVGKWVIYSLFHDFKDALMRQPAQECKSSVPSSSSSPTSSQPTLKRAYSSVTELSTVPPVPELPSNLKDYSVSPPPDVGSKYNQPPADDQGESDTARASTGSGTDSSISQEQQNVDTAHTEEKLGSHKRSPSSSSLVGKLTRRLSFKKATPPDSPDKSNKKISSETRSDNEHSNKDPPSMSVTQSQASLTHTPLPSHPQEMPATSAGMMPSSNAVSHALSSPPQPPAHSPLPPFPMPRNTTMEISEESPEASTSINLYTGTLSSLSQDHEFIRNILPHWALDLILYDRSMNKEPVKFGFSLLPMKDSGLKELPNGNYRLSANRLIRLRKLISYVSDKLSITPPYSSVTSLSSPNVLPSSLGSPSSGSTTVSASQSQPTDSTSGMESLPSNPLPPEEYIELLCQGSDDKPLSPLVTLGTVKTFIWKGQGELVLWYRLKSTS
ncbi:WD40-repeat-containing domain protein [Paraphysoderma sedebokerense]|nr:WD40-repeat-containing domain protein [Paraphysoderma sedebokerense]